MVQKLISKSMISTAERIIKDNSDYLNNPFMIIDLDSSLNKVVNFYNKALSFFDNPIIAYSYKSNNLSILCQKIQSLGHSAEVCSLDEIKLALKDGFAFEKIFFDGPLKKYGELLFAISNNIKIQIDNELELDIICGICKNTGNSCAFYFRLAHYYQDDNISRFGLTSDQIINFFKNNDINNGQMNFLGFHIHVGTNLKNSSKLVSTLIYYMPILKKYMPNHGYLNIGSGYPADSFCDDPMLVTPGPEIFFSEIKNTLDNYLGNSWRSWTFIFEPGRYFIEDDGYFIGRVMNIKKRHDYSILTSNIGINQIPSVNRWHHIISPLNNSKKNNLNEIQKLVGFNCFEQDFIFGEIKNFSMKTGDYFIIRGCGAYDLQTSNSWTRTLPIIYVILNSNIRIARLAQTENEFRSRDIPLNNELITVDTKIQLAGIDQKFSVDIFKLIQNNIEFLSYFLDWPKYVKSTDDITTFINEKVIEHHLGNSKTYTISYNEKIVGIISLNSIDKKNKSADIGYWISSDMTGKGIVSTSLQKLIENFSKSGDIQRFVIKCAEKNEKSNQLAIRNGFSLEGILHQAEIINNKKLNQNIYAKIINY